MSTTLSRTAASGHDDAAGMTAAAIAQTTAADPHHPGTTLAQAMPPSGMMGQAKPGRRPVSPPCRPLSPA